MVHGVGLEPTSLAAQEPKSCAFANFASRARGIQYITQIVKSNIISV